MNVTTQHTSRSRACFVEAEQGVDKRAFAGAVWTEEADGSAVEGSVQAVEDAARAEIDGEVIEFEGSGH